MSDAKRQGTGAAHSGDGAGGDARGRATHGAVADADAARAAKARRNAWLLAGFAVLVYVGYMVWFVVRGGA